MANRLFSPNQQYADTTGLPYAGGSLTFYASGTSTPLATYSNRALSIANTNPVVLDSAGRAGDIFLQNLAYKVVLSDVNLNPIWTADPVYSSDFSTTASFLSGAGSPNGVVAGSAGSPTVPASVYWDTTNNILYVATTTGNAATTVWTAVNASTAAAVVPTPMGYLTPTTNVPVIPSDVLAATSVFYTPFVGNLVPIYNGSSFVPTVFSELTLTLNAAHAASNLYDVYVFNNSGVPTLVTGPSWSAGTAGSVTVGSCNRGTGAGGSALSRVNGTWTNAVQMTARNGATTYTVNANLATYVGTLYMDGTNGQVTCHRSYGQNRKFGIWNAYNRVPIYLKAGDPTASWAYTTATIRASNNASSNSVFTLVGLPEETLDFTFKQKISNTFGASAQIGAEDIFIGVNSTTAFTGTAGEISMASLSSAGTGTVIIEAVARYFTTSLLTGINQITALERCTSVGSTNAFFGAEERMLLSASYRG